MNERNVGKSETERAWHSKEQNVYDNAVLRPLGRMSLWIPVSAVSGRLRESKGNTDCHPEWWPRLADLEGPCALTVRQFDEA